MVTCCSPCNGKKGQKSLEAFGTKLRGGFPRCPQWHELDAAALRHRRDQRQTHHHSWALWIGADDEDAPDDDADEGKFGSALPDADRGRRVDDTLAQYAV